MLNVNNRRWRINIHSIHLQRFFTISFFLSPISFPTHSRYRQIHEHHVCQQAKHVFSLLNGCYDALLTKFLIKVEQLWKRWKIGISLICINMKWHTNMPVFIVIQFGFSRQFIYYLLFMYYECGAVGFSYCRNVDYASLGPLLNQTPNREFRYKSRYFVIIWMCARVTLNSGYSMVLFFFLRFNDLNVVIVSRIV